MKTKDRKTRRRKVLSLTTRRHRHLKASSEPCHRTWKEVHSPGQTEGVSSSSVQVTVKDTHISTDSSTPRSRTLKSSERSQSTAGERRPDLTSVLATSQNLIGLDDSITSREERRTTGLELHAVQDELDDKRIAVLGDRSAALGDWRVVEVVGVLVLPVIVGLRREESLAEAVLLDEALGDDEEELSPTVHKER